MKVTCTSVPIKVSATSVKPAYVIIGESQLVRMQRISFVHISFELSLAGVHLSVGLGN